ncbi:MAG: DUF4131 domain-containing protein [Pyrinomonadaceae bacterium]
MPVDSLRTYSRSPLLMLAAAFAAGIVVDKYVLLEPWVVLVVMSLTVLAALVVREMRTATVALVLAYFTAGSLCSFVAHKSISPDRLRSLYDTGQIASGDEVQIDGFVTAGPEPAYGGSFVEIAATKIEAKGEHRNASGRLRVFVPLESVESLATFERSGVAYGAEMRVRCSPTREEQYQNPGVRSRLEIMDEQGIDAAASIKSP